MVEVEGIIIEVDDYQDSLGERDNYLRGIEEQIQNKRDFLLNRGKHLEKLKMENHFLKGVQNDYTTYYSTILKQKEEQIAAINMLNQYLNEMIVNSQVTENDIQNTKKEQRHILKEMDRIKKELDNIIKVNSGILEI